MVKIPVRFCDPSESHSVQIFGGGALPKYDQMKNEITVMNAIGVVQKDYKTKGSSCP
jgi:hypothetical protein